MGRSRRQRRGAFPTLPDRTQFNRLVRRHHSALVACFRSLVEGLDATRALTRDAKGRGHGWLAGRADIGWSNQLGWYEGFHVLMAVNPMEVITGVGFGVASAKDQPLAETFLAARPRPYPALPSLGAPAEKRARSPRRLAGCRPHPQTSRFPEDRRSLSSHG